MDDAARVLILAAMGEAAEPELAELYRFGDAAERRGLLRALAYLPLGDRGRGLVDDAIRTNDTRLVAAALGPYATEHLDDAARTLLLAALGDRVEQELRELYRYGDAAERRGLLRALPFLPLGDRALDLVDDAIRTNDTRLIAAALGPYATEHLPDAAYDQAVLKCVFIGVPIAPLDGLPARATPETARMLAAFVHERVAAGRDIPAEVWDVIDRHPPEQELALIESERQSPFEDRRAAAERALRDHHPGGVA